METLLSFIAFFSLVGLVTGLIKPVIFSRFVKKVPKRKIIALVFGGAMISSAFIGSAINSPKSDIVDNQKTPVVEQQINQIDDSQEQKAKKEEFNNQTNEPAQNEPESIVSNLQESQSQQSVEITQPSSNLFSVIRVVDGDTIKVNINGTTETLRLIGINTPETVDPRKPVECFGIEASNKAKSLLIGKKVRLESDPTQGERGIYGRLLSYVWLEDGTFFNKKMISDGYAYEYTYNTPYKYQTEFKQAEKEARENKRGLWANNACSDYTESSSDDSSQAVPTDQSGDKYYTSSYHSSTYYYPEDCDGWKSLSEKYLKSYDSLEILLQVYPDKTLSPQCQ